MSIVDKIKSLCNEKKISLSELERILGFGSSSIRKWDKQAPSSERIKLVADYFNVSTDYLLGHTTKENEVDEQFMQFFRTETNELTTEEKSEMVEDVREFLEFRKAQLLKRKGK